MSSVVFIWVTHIGSPNIWQPGRAFTSIARKPGEP